MKAYKWLIEPTKNKDGSYNTDVWRATVECDAEMVNRIEDIVQEMEDEEEAEEE